MKHLVFLTAAASLFALSACGGPEDDGGASNAGATRPSTGAERAALPLPSVFQDADLPDSEGAAFLDAMAALPGAEMRENGSVVIGLGEGAGPMPGPKDLTKVHFVARVAGTDEPFGSSYADGAPAILAMDQSLPGWSQTLQTMQEGAKVRVALPPELAFGERGMPGGPIGPNQVTVYDLELLKVYAAGDDAALEALAKEMQDGIDSYSARAQEMQAIAQQQMSGLASANKARSALFVAAQGAKAETTTTDSGLVYEVIRDGDGEVSPAIGDMIRVHYRGTLPSGEVFDSSYDRGEPAEFELGRVIEGWNEALQLMQAGDQYKLYIPAELAYGTAGTRGGPIGPNQALIFDVELLDITPAETEASDDAE